MGDNENIREFWEAGLRFEAYMWMLYADKAKARVVDVTATEHAGLQILASEEDPAYLYHIKKWHLESKGFG